MATEAPKRSVAGSYFAIGAIIGGVFGYGAHALVDRGMSFPTVAKPTLPASPAPEPPPDLVVHTGRPTYEYGIYKLPVVVENRTHTEHSYARVDCDFYDQSGAFVTTSHTNWLGLPARGAVSGEIAFDGVNPKDFSTYRCRASAD